MAILNKIRQRSIFLILIIALALFAFIAADLFKSGGFNAAKQNTVATINGVDLDREDFSRKVEAQQRQLGPNATSMRAMNSVWEQELSRVVLEEQYDDLGIQVGPERRLALLKSALENNPSFQDADGFFSEARMQEYIATAKDARDNGNPAQYEGWVNFETSQANTEKERIYFNLIKAGLGATLKDGEVAFQLENNKIDLQYVQIPYTTIPNEEVEVTESDVKAYINAHKEAYESDATRSIQYVKFDEKPTLEDENALKAELQGLLEDQTQTNGVVYNGFKTVEDVQEFVLENSDLPYQDRYFFKKDLPAAIQDAIFALEAGGIHGPYKDGNFMKVSKAVEVTQLHDSLQTRHLLVAYTGAARSQATRTKEEAKALADSILAVVKRRKSKFSDLVNEFTDDVASKAKGGEYWFGPGDGMAQEFKDFVIENRVGAMDVVETDFGYHVMEVLDKRNEQKAMKVATVAKEIVPSEKTISDVYNKTQKFEIAATQGNFAEVAKESGYAALPVNAIKPLEENIPGQGSQRAIVQWAFEEGTDVGDIKRFQVNDGYIVAQVTKATKKGLMSVADASVTVTPIVRNQKKAAIIKGRINSTDINAIASTQNSTVKTATAVTMANPTLAGAGREPKVVGRAFALNEGATSEPIEGDRGVYVVKVNKVTPATAIDNYAPFATQETNKARAAVRTKVQAALKKAAEVEDNRANFY